MSNKSNNSKPAADQDGALQTIDWKDFRDHLATAEKDGRRKWLYPKKPEGRYYRWRTLCSFVLLAIMFVGPFIKIRGNPLLMINIVERKFSILGQIFWPQDMALFAIATLIFLLGIVVFTAAFGRLWCGWTCPQTVLMELVFRKIEYAIEGDALTQKAAANTPLTGARLARKLLKHAIFLALSFLIGNVLLSYIIGIESLTKIVTDDPRHHVTGLTFMILFTMLFYGIFARFREQACTFICPYGRFQSTLIDENSIVVAYDHKRGESRARWHRDEPAAARKNRKAGDCIDCLQCVAVCPTGIDIRNGTQMECVHCTACIDACDHVMDKIGLSRGLIRYASLDGIERGQKLRVTPRIIGYCTLLTVLTALFITLLITRSDVDATFLRAPGALFTQMPDGHVSNLYLVKLTNKTHRDLNVRLELLTPGGTLANMGGELVVPAEKQIQSSVLVEFPPAALKQGSTPIVVAVKSGDKILSRLKTGFLGPRTATP